jgi:hypothetical protein
MSESTEPVILSEPPARRLTGFATLSIEERKRIASKGGKVAHARGLAHEFTSETGAKAGRLGGLATSQDREHMSRLGKRGGSMPKKRRVKPEVPPESAA